MNRAEALELVRIQLDAWRGRTYAELVRGVGHSHRFEVNGASGASYQGDIRMFWDNSPGGAVRVIGAIDDGGWRAFVPLTDSFIVAPDGTFVGE